MRNAVAGEEALQADDAAGILRPDQHRTADPALDQADPAQDQRAHDALAEIGFGDQQRAQPLRRNQKCFDVAFGMAVDQRDAARELADLGEKLSRPLVDHRRDVAEAVALGDRNMAGQHHEHAGSGLAGLEQHFAVLVVAHLAEPAHARDLLRRQRREGLLQAGKRAFSKALPSAPVPVAGVTAISVSRYRKVAKPAAGPTRLFARLFSAVVMWCGGFIMGRCGRHIVSSPRLRFSPLEVFTQRLLQPVPPCIFFRQSGLPGLRPCPCRSSS